MTGAQGLRDRGRLDRVPDAFRTTRWGLQSEQHRSVPHEEVLGGTLVEDVRRAVCCPR